MSRPDLVLMEMTFRGLVILVDEARAAVLAAQLRVVEATGLAGEPVAEGEGRQRWRRAADELGLAQAEEALQQATIDLAVHRGVIAATPAADITAIGVKLRCALGHTQAGASYRADAAPLPLLVHSALVDAEWLGWAESARKAAAR